MNVLNILVLETVLPTAFFLLYILILDLQNSLMQRRTLPAFLTINKGQAIKKVRTPAYASSNRKSRQSTPWAA